MSLMLIIAVAWVCLACPLGLLIGRSLRLADAREAALRLPTVPDFVPAEWTASADTA